MKPLLIQYASVSLGALRRKKPRWVTPLVDCHYPPCLRTWPPASCQPSGKQPGRLPLLQAGDHIWFRNGISCSKRSNETNYARTILEFKPNMILKEEPEEDVVILWNVTEDLKLLLELNVTSLFCLYNIEDISAKTGYRNAGFERQVSISYWKGHLAKAEDE